jgi:hypothetical protein
MSEYPFEDKIHSKDSLTYKTVYSADNTKIGEVEVAFADSIIVRLEKEDTLIKYQIPRLEIATLIDDKIMLRSKQSEIDQKYRTSSIQKSPI